MRIFLAVEVLRKGSSPSVREKWLQSSWTTRSASRMAASAADASVSKYRYRTSGDRMNCRLSAGVSGSTQVTFLPFPASQRDRAVQEPRASPSGWVWATTAMREACRIIDRNACMFS